MHSFFCSWSGSDAFNYDDDYVSAPYPPSLSHSWWVFFLLELCKNERQSSCRRFRQRLYSLSDGWMDNGPGLLLLTCLLQTARDDTNIPCALLLAGLLRIPRVHLLNPLHDSDRHCLIRARFIPRHEPTTSEAFFNVIPLVT